MGQYAQAKGTPAPQLAVAGTGVLLLLGGMSGLLGAYPTVDIVLLIIFLLGASFQIHNYWKEKDAQARQAEPAGDEGRRRDHGHDRADDQGQKRRARVTRSAHERRVREVHEEQREDEWHCNARTP